MVTYLKSGWSDLQWTGWMKGLSRCAQSSFHTGYYPRRSTSCAALAPSGAPTTKRTRSSEYASGLCSYEALQRQCRSQEAYDANGRGPCAIGV
jgi:hypothetical protein